MAGEYRLEWQILKTRVFSTERAKEGLLGLSCWPFFWWLSWLYTTNIVTQKRDLLYCIELQLKKGLIFFLFLACRKAQEIGFEKFDIKGDNYTSFLLGHCALGSRSEDYNGHQLSLSLVVNKQRGRRQFQRCPLFLQDQEWVVILYFPEHISFCIPDSDLNTGYSLGSNRVLTCRPWYVARSQKVLSASWN